MRLPISLYLQNFYEKYKNERMFGFYLGRSAILVLRDPELIKDVLVKDFSIFADRGFIVHERVCHVAFLIMLLITSLRHIHLFVARENITFHRLNSAKLLSRYFCMFWKHNEVKIKNFKNLFERGLCAVNCQCWVCKTVSVQGLF